MIQLWNKKCIWNVNEHFLEHFLSVAAFPEVYISMHFLKNDQNYLFLRPSKIFLFPKAELFKKFSVILEKSNYSVTMFREETKSN